MKSYVKFKLEVGNRHHDCEGEVRFIKDDRYILRVKKDNVHFGDKGVYVLAPTIHDEVMCIIETRRACKDDDVPNIRHHHIHKLTPVSIKDVKGSLWGRYVEEVYYL